MKTTQLGGNEYLIKDLGLRDQLNIARRLAPTSLVIEGMTNPENAGKPKTLLVTLMLSRLTDEDSDFVVGKCLAVVFRTQRIEGKVESYPIVNAAGGLQYSDIDLKTMIDLTTEVILDSLGGFFHTALSEVPTEGATPN